MSTKTHYKWLQDNLEYLKLKQCLLHLDETIELATTQHISHIEWLLQLTDYEVDVKRENIIHHMVKISNFPHLKTLKDFDFTFQPQINELQIKNLASLHFMDQAENIIFLGSSGVGKTHLATSLGIESAQSRRSTYFIKCHDLIQNLRKARDEGRLEVRLKHYTRYQLLIIDEIGYLPLQEGDANLLFQIIDRRYEQKSTIVTTNINFDERTSILQDERVASAIVDRLLHHAHVISISGDSYRLRHHMQMME